MSARISLLLYAVAAATFPCLSPCQAQVATEHPAEVRDCLECIPLVALPTMPSTGERLLIARHELTWAEYVPAVLEANCPLPPLPDGSQYPADIRKLADDYPLAWLAVNDLDCYLGWASKKTGHVYRLPTGAEWEYAARAGAPSRFPWGNDPGYNNAAVDTWFDSGALKRRETVAFDPRSRMGRDQEYFAVEAFRPNAWGLYDVIGNLPEVTSDTRPGLPICIRNAGVNRCVEHAVRGGSVLSIAYRLEPNGRRTIVGENPHLFQDQYWFGGGFSQRVGFRLVRVANR